MSEMLGSRKFKALLLGLILETLNAFGVSDPAIRTQLAELIALLVTVYIGAQGLADHGKSKAEIEAVLPNKVKAINGGEEKTDA